MDASPTSSEHSEESQDATIILSEHAEQGPDSENMFASVWVKVELDEDDAQETRSNVGDTEKKSAQRKRKKRKHNKTFKCELCEYTTVYSNCLKLHMAGHSSDKPHSCESCNYTTKYPSVLRRHILIKHQANEADPTTGKSKTLPMHKCDVCDFSTYFKWNLKSHKRKHRVDKPYKCSHCPFETAYQHNLVKHAKVHSGSTSTMFYKCDKCPFATKFEGHISRHLAKIHNEVMYVGNKCDRCDFSTKIRWRLNLHTRRSKQEDPLKCGYCEFETSYMCESKKHKETHKLEMYKNKTNALQDNDAMHISDEQMDSAAEYRPLDDHEIQRDDYRNHFLDPNCIDWDGIQVLESDDKDRPFRCHICSYKSKFKAAVRRHFQRHHTETQTRPYKCCHCDFSTKTKEQISLHNKRSHSEVVITCPQCPFTTIYKCEMVTHQKNHYTYKCTECDYSCKQKYNLQKHFAASHLVNGIKCSYCDFKAAKIETVFLHEATHTGIKPFKCMCCDYTSFTKRSLDNHVKRYHRDVKKDVTFVNESKIESLKLPLPL